MEIIDKTGEPPSIEDIRRADDAVIGALIKDMIKLISVSPSLTMELSNIHRCLSYLEKIYKSVDAQGTK